MTDPTGTNSPWGGSPLAAQNGGAPGTNSFTSNSTSGVPSWVLSGASPDIDFYDNRAWNGTALVTPASLLTVVRAQTSNYTTNLVPTSASGFAYTTFAANTARITVNLGLLVEEGRTNLLLNSTVPVTQTTASLANGTYTLWVNGAGSATSSAGTATGSGFGAASQGSPNTFVLTGTAGTVTITVSGSLNAFQLELNPGTVSAGTSLIITGASTQARAADVVTLTNPPVPGAAFTIYGSGIPLAATNYTVNQFLADWTDSSTNDRIDLLRVITSGLAQFRMFSQGTGGNPAPGGVWAANAAMKLANAFNGSTATGAAAGSITGTGSSLSAPAAFTIFNIGNQNSGNFFNGYIERIALWPTIAQPATFLQTITSGSGP